MQTKHKTEACMVREDGPHMDACGEEAVSWFEWFGVPMDTFYLCAMHSEALTHGKPWIEVLNPDNGDYITKETAVYSCSEECKECN